MRLRSINWTRLLVILLTILVALVLSSFVLWVVFHFISDLLLLFLAVILAYLLTPLIAALQHYAGLPRGPAILAVYAVIVIMVIALGSYLAPPVVEQARTLQYRLPSLLRQLDMQSSSLEQALRDRGIVLPLHGLTGNAAGVIGGTGPSLLAGLLGLVSSVGTIVFDFVLVLVMAAYLLHDGDSIVRAIETALPPRYAPGAGFVTRSAAAIIGRYVRAQLAVATMVAILGGAGAVVLRVPYAPLIAIIAFLAESIPVIGPIIATIPAVLFALSQSPWQAIAILIWFVVVQQLEQNVIMPRLSGHAVGIHPVAAIMAVLIGYDLGGLWGAIFAVPLMGFGMALLREGWRLLMAVPEETVPAVDRPPDMVTRQS